MSRTVGKCLSAAAEGINLLMILPSSTQRSGQVHTSPRVKDSSLMGFQSSLSSLSLIHLFFPCSCSCQKPVPLSTKTPGLRAPQLIAGYTEFWFGDQACKELLGMPSPLCVQHYFTTTCTSITGVGKTLGLFNGFSSVLEQSAPLLWDSAVSVQLCCLGIQTPESTNPALLTPPLWKMSASGWHNYINVVIILEGL